MSSGIHPAPQKGIMNKERLLELALASLHQRMVKIDLEIEALRNIIDDGTKPETQAKTVAAPVRKRRTRTAAERKAQSKKMKAIWAAKKAKAKRGGGSR